MKRNALAALCVLGLLFGGCTGGAAGKPSDDLSDLIVVGHSPGNGDELDLTDSLDGFNALNNPTLVSPGDVTIVFSTSLDPDSVINLDPTDPQRTRNVRLFFFDTSQGPFDPDKAVQPGVNPPGANVIVPADTLITETNVPFDTLLIRPNRFTATSPMPEGQYSVIIERGVRAADGTPLRGREYFFFFRVGQDVLQPVVVASSPANGQRNVDPTTELRITMSETILASTVNANTIQVFYQPAGSTTPTAIPGSWFTDGGNQAGNNFPNLQLDAAGNPGFSGQSPRNGVDVVFRPDLDAFPVNMFAEDPNDPFCTLVRDPPEKGNRGFPLGQTITVQFVTTGTSVSDTAGNRVAAGSPGLTFNFETKPKSPDVFAPGTPGAVYFGDTFGVGVIDVDPAETPYQIGPNPARPANTVVRLGAGAAAQVVRVTIPDLVDVKTDARPYSAFYTFLCGGLLTPTIFHPMVYGASRTSGGGEVIVIDSFKMERLGRFGTPSPGGISIASLPGSFDQNRLVVSNFSANTATIFDIGRLGWFELSAGVLGTQGGLLNSVAAGTKLILNEQDFVKAFPNQTGDPFSQRPGPPVIGTVSVGISPTGVEITQFPNTHGPPALCGSPVYSSTIMVGVLNAGEQTADFTELTNLVPGQAVVPDLDGVSLSSAPKDIEWLPASLLPFAGGGATNYAIISSVGGTVELFASGFGGLQPTLRGPTTNLAPNKIVNNISGFEQPNSVIWAPQGAGTFLWVGGTASALVAETGKNRVVQIAITQEFPSNQFTIINSSHPAGSGPADITGSPEGTTGNQRRVGFFPCGPTFERYYVANTGGGTVQLASYLGGVIGTNINVPGVLFVSSWWSR